MLLGFLLVAIKSVGGVLLRGLAGSTPPPPSPGAGVRQQPAVFRGSLLRLTHSLWAVVEQDTDTFIDLWIPIPLYSVCGGSCEKRKV